MFICCQHILEVSIQKWVSTWWIRSMPAMINLLDRYKKKKQKQKCPQFVLGGEGDDEEAETEVEYPM